MTIGVNLTLSIPYILPHSLPLIVIICVRKCSRGLIKLLNLISLLSHQGIFLTLRTEQQDSIELTAKSKQKSFKIMCDLLIISLRMGIFSLMLGFMYLKPCCIPTFSSRSRNNYRTLQNSVLHILGSLRPLVPFIIIISLQYRVFTFYNIYVIFFIKYSNRIWILVFTVSPLEFRLMPYIDNNFTLFFNPSLSST